MRYSDINLGQQWLGSCLHQCWFIIEGFCGVLQELLKILMRKLTLQITRVKSAHPSGTNELTHAPRYLQDHYLHLSTYIFQCIYFILVAIQFLCSLKADLQAIDGPPTSFVGDDAERKPLINGTIHVDDDVEPGLICFVWIYMCMMDLLWRHK